MELTRVRDLADELQEQVGRVVIGQETVVEGLLVTLLSGGHVLLEQVLRRSPSADRNKLLRTICEKVRVKIGWAPEVSDPENFLRAFYAAQRGRLEHKMLLGTRQERKVG